MSALNDVDVECTVMLGSTVLPIREVLKMSRGTIIPLDCQEKDPSVLVVNGRPVAKGQICVAGERMSLKVEEVVGKGN
ncbi:FliM/FliN family flagellar motor switch protein [Erythrobacter aureus]|uniref:Flagellar motor switch protein FliN n=1 Tax=Erythrobacter aureus TaxID=2182384 RepID=A0A345YIE8_9SPHN|nr:FliM/FliN family flagellar motor switch protein [Erythrobacter aureus]AXK43700.1 flagellar motor switch protein FliN [Erythrobacter aureus]